MEFLLKSPVSHHSASLEREHRAIRSLFTVTARLRSSKRHTTSLFRWTDWQVDKLIFITVLFSQHVFTSSSTNSCFPCTWKFIKSTVFPASPFLSLPSMSAPRNVLASLPGIVWTTAAADRGRGRREAATTSGYFSWRLLLRCGDYVCPLICAETRQRGPLSVPPRHGEWVSGSSGLGPARYRPIIYHGVSRTFFVLPSTADRRALLLPFAYTNQAPKRSLLGRWRDWRIVAFLTIYRVVILTSKSMCFNKLTWKSMDNENIFEWIFDALTRISSYVNRVRFYKLM